MTVEQAAAVFEGIGATPGTALDQCHAESVRFRAHLTQHGITADLVSGFKFADLDGHKVIVHGHTAVRVEGVVYDWTARQFGGADWESIPFPLIQPYPEWRAEWPDLTGES